MADENEGATISPTEAKISQIIKDLSTESSFSAEAMRQFMELREEVQSQESTISYLRRHNKEKDEEIKNIEATLEHTRDAVGDLTSELEAWRSRGNELQDREEQCLRLELTAEFNEKRVEDHQSMVGLIFRNTELRKRSFGEEMHYQPGCVEIRDEFGNIKQYAEQAGHVPVPVKKEQIENEE